MKPGFYEIDVQGYYRAGLSAELTDSLKQVCNSYIYATTSIGEMTVPMKNIMDGAQEAPICESGETPTTDLEGTTVYIPENMEAASTYFTNELYPNTLKVQVGEDGKLTIAIKKWNYIDSDWTIFTGWQLYYLGKTGANFSDELDAVEELSNINAKATQVFSIDGRQSTRLNRGINIVRMSDGSVHKVLVK